VGAGGDRFLLKASTLAVVVACVSLHTNLHFNPCADDERSVLSEQPAEATPVAPKQAQHAGTKQQAPKQQPPPTAQQLAQAKLQELQRLRQRRVFICMLKCVFQDLGKNHTPPCSVV